MHTQCKNGLCATPNWIRRVLFGAGIYHILFGIWAICLPFQWFDLISIAHPNHPLLWQAVGLIVGILGIAMMMAARNPLDYWMTVSIALIKFTVGIVGFSIAFANGQIPIYTIWLMVVNDLIWWPPFAIILWTCIKAHSGVPPTRSMPLEIGEAAREYTLSNGKTLEEASRSRLIAIVFMRHFGCTFTRQILRGLEGIQREATAHGADLVLVHMLQSGKETQYLGERSGVLRIADPRCELYRAFGLGKGGFMELFGPHVMWRMTISLFKGCGVGHLAGDGLQMPGAFLYRDGKIITSQRAHSASDLPDLPGLFEELPSRSSRETLTA